MKTYMLALILSMASVALCSCVSSPTEPPADTSAESEIITILTTKKSESSVTTTVPAKETATETTATEDFPSNNYYIENFKGRLSDIHVEDEFLQLKNCDIIIDTEMPQDFALIDCNVTLERQFTGASFTDLYISNCTFDKTPDFTGIKLSPYYDYGEFHFKCPSQKITGVDTIEAYGSTIIDIKAETDISNFKVMKRLDYGGTFPYFVLIIESTGEVNVDDLLKNDYSDDLWVIQFIDCATKEQFDQLVEKYPDKEITVEIDDVKYYYQGIEYK